MAILISSEGNLNQCRVIGEETIGVLDVCLVYFPWMLGKGQGREAVDDGVDQ